MGEQHFEPPKTVKELGIHVSYMREDIVNLTRVIEDNAKNYTTKTELENLRKVIEKDYVLKADFEKLKSKITPIIVLTTTIGSVLISAVTLAVVNWILKGGTQE